MINYLNFYERAPVAAHHESVTERLVCVFF